MPVFKCPMDGCTYETDDVEPGVAVAFLNIHNNVHIAENNVVKQRAPKLDRPSIGKESSEEVWNTFQTRWRLFKRGTHLSADETVQQLFECCEEDLGDTILKSHDYALSGTEEDLLMAIKQLAVIPVARCVRRSELLSLRQDHGENCRSFVARLKGKAATCSYSLVCPRDGCDQNIDFTEVVVKDVLVAGLNDDDIKKDVMGWTEVDKKSVDELISFVEAKEMARDALLPQMSTAAVSSYKTSSNRSRGKASKEKVPCDGCQQEIDKFIWSKHKKRLVECSLCSTCYQRSRSRPKAGGRGSKGESAKDEASALLIGSVMCDDSDVSRQSTTEISKLTSSLPEHKLVELDHFIFDSADGWKQSESMSHPTLELEVTVDKTDYAQLGRQCPKIKPSRITVVSDTGAQSCLWGLSDYLRCGFRRSDLIPVKRTMLAANREKIDIEGAVMIRLSGRDNHGKTYTAPIMVYVSSCTNRFYLSREALVQLQVIPKDFPRVGAATSSSNCAVEQSCDCPKRSLPPGRPASLPFPATPENIEKMKSWLLDRYSSSTFNKCPHQTLVGMTGPPMRIHISPDAVPVAISTPSVVPRHWEQATKDDLDRDESLDVLEKVPLGTPSDWVHRMVIVPKHDGSGRRVVDMSPLNKFCLRETHHVKPPFLQAKQVPSNVWKTLLDAWNGFHSVPLHPDDRHLTTFLTPWGRYRYKVAPMGFLASGDGYTRRYDEIIMDVQRKTKCVDDTVLWDSDLEEHWWRVIDYLELTGRNGIVLNPEKMQFAQRSVDFAGFQITDSTIRPQEKFIKAIQDFPTPTRITDVRSWFGLVHQVSHYSKLTTLMAPFKYLLSPKTKFVWNDKLDHAFVESKKKIIEAIRYGVEIFDPSRPTCLQPDWSKTGLGYFLSQKCCECDSAVPDCCPDGWKIVMAGSRFARPAESRYAPVEGEALAIAWALEQTKYFTRGCNKLVVLTDHKPLIKLFGDRTLDEISNPRLFRLKQRTLMWKFSIYHRPGKLNFAPDALSRNPVPDAESFEEVSEISFTEILAGIRDGCLAEEVAGTTDADVQAITWERVRIETQKDPNLMRLMGFVQSVFPLEKKDMPPELEPYWSIRDQLIVVDGVLLRNDEVVLPLVLRQAAIDSVSHQKSRVIIPPSLRKDVLDSLHAAHQGISAMHERARVSVYWPGITKDIEQMRMSCTHCHRIAPSQPRLPPIEPTIPTTPFECIVGDYFHFKGHYYLVIADRLSGWMEQHYIKVGTNESGSAGLCKALRKTFVTFGVPVELTSDGGPEFSSSETACFLRRWGVKHRVSSVSLASSNGRAELAVKATKRLLMDNVKSNGQLDNDKMLRALLILRNTPDPGCKLSPAQVLFGRPLRDSLPFINRELMCFDNPQFSTTWRDAWKFKEVALRDRYVKSLENLKEHSRPLLPLECGNHVMIQNQSGPYPNKWDKSGIVVEVKPFDQYVVKVAGSGRLTLRNRRYLRLFEPHNLTGSVPPPIIRGSDCYHTSTDKQAVELPNQSSNPGAVEAERTQSTSCNVPPDGYSDSYSEADHDLPSQNDSPSSSGIVKGQRMLTCLAPHNGLGAKETPLYDDSSDVNSSVRRSARQKEPRKVYDAASGQYKSCDNCK